MLNEIEKLAVINQKADVQMSSEPVHQLSLYLFFVFVSLYLSIYYLYISSLYIVYIYYLYILPLYSVFIYCLYIVSLYSIYIFFIYFLYIVFVYSSSCLCVSTQCFRPYFLICRKLCLLEYLNNLVVRLLCEK